MAIWLALILLLWFGWALLIRWIVGVRPFADDGYASAIVRGFQVYARFWQRTRYEGLENIPPALDDGRPDRPLIVVANHTAGIDPILIQAACPFAIRFMMARDMRVWFLDAALEYARVIFVDRENPTGMELREAIQEVKEGGALGVFPEGQISRSASPTLRSPGDSRNTRPPAGLLPFREGVGLMIRRSGGGAAVLPVVISGTPSAPSAWGSIWKRSRPGARVRFLELMRFGKDQDAGAITRRLQSVMEAALAESPAGGHRGADRVPDTL